MSRSTPDRDSARVLATAAAVLCGLALAFCVQAANAAVQARVEPPVVDEMESVRLTLRVDGSNSTEALDLSALDGDFEVLGTNTSSQFQSINGQVQSWVEYQINLRPKRPGKLEIPAIAVGGQSTRPLSITVRPLAPEVRRAIDRMVFFEVDVSPNPVYVQAEALMTRRLYYASGVQIYSDLPGVPDIPNAVVLPVGDTRSTTEVRPEGRYGVLQQRYAIFPEQSGSLVIPEISVTSSVRIESGGRTRRSGIRVSTPEIRLEVLPVPASYPADAPWLPARDVSIRDDWAQGALSFELGEPARRKLTVEVAGNTGSSIPPIELNLPQDSFKQYPEPARIDENTATEHVVGTREQAYSIVPVAPGTPQLPELRLTWWDTVNEQVRIATAAAAPVRIAGDPLSPVAQPGSPAPADAEPPPGRATAAAADQAGTPYPIWLPALTAFAFGGWLTTWLTMRRKPAERKREHSRPSGEQSWKALVAACRKGDPGPMRNAWIQHLGRCWNTAPDRTVALIRQHDDGRRLLDGLNRRLYSARADASVDGQELLDTTRTMLKPARNPKTRRLPELHAH